MKRFTKHMIFLGLKIFSFVILYGINFFFVAAGVSFLITKNYFGSYTPQAEYIIPIIPTAGLIFLVSWMLFSLREPRCPHCNKRLLDEIPNSREVKHE